MKEEERRVKRNGRRGREREGNRERGERRGSRGGCWQRRLLIARSNPARTIPFTLRDPNVGPTSHPPEASAARAKASKLQQPTE